MHSQEFILDQQFSKAHEKYASGKWELCEQEFKAVLANEPYNLLAYYFVGVAVRKQNRYIESLFSFLPAIALLKIPEYLNYSEKITKYLDMPNIEASNIYADAAYASFLSYTKTSQISFITLARQLYRTASELGFNDPFIYRDIGLCDVLLCDYNAALDNFKTAVDLNPSNVSYRLSLARHFLRMQKYLDAFTQLRNAIRSSK